MTRYIRGFLCWVFVWLVLFPAPSAADAFKFLGQTTFSYDDRYGDGEDRWRTGGTSVSLFFKSANAAWEMRARADLITPADTAGDRLAAAYWGLAAFRHGTSGSLNHNIGVELIGVDDGIFDLAEDLSPLLPDADPGDAQVMQDQVYASLQGEVSRDYQMAGGTVRPFVGAEAGFENYVRAGADFVLGGDGFSDHVTRNAVTGFLLPPRGERLAVAGSELAMRLYLGADLNRDLGSRLMDGADVAAKDYRSRLRAGAMLGDDRLNMFYGVTRMGREFEGQSEAQWLGTLSVSFRF